MSHITLLIIKYICEYCYHNYNELSLMRVACSFLFDEVCTHGNTQVESVSIYSHATVSIIVFQWCELCTDDGSIGGLLYPSLSVASQPTEL